MTAEQIRRLEAEIADHRAARSTLALRLGAMAAQRDAAIRERDAALARLRRLAVDGILVVEVQRHIQLAPGDKLLINPQDPRL